MQCDQLRINSLTVMGGRDKSGNPEPTDVLFTPGQITALLGPTGSGKSRFLYDIESLANNDTPSGRSILLDGEKPDHDRRFELQGRLVAQLTQNMNFVLDMGVQNFIRAHAASRNAPDPELAADEVIAAANDLAGEPFSTQAQITQLSGGQSRALMIADAALLSWSPILLIDEIENAGVDKRRALDLLLKSEKIIVIATHDPVLALSADRRLVFEHGAVCKVQERNEAEKQLLEHLSLMEDKFSQVRAQLRLGNPMPNL